MNQKHEQQNIQMNKLDKTRRQQTDKVVTVLESQKLEMNKLKQKIKLQDCDKKFAEQNERIAKLENIIKAQNDLIASMVPE